MDTHYRVFISSPFKDLEKERIILAQTLLKKGCAPTGMEWFPAVDEVQFSYIKQVIDDADYFVLLLGGLYGTIAIDGKSYTEKEYDYAVAQGKKVIALVQRNPENCETDDDRKMKFAKFHKKVTKERLVNFWSKPEELSGHLAISLDYTIKNYPAKGWIRCESEKCNIRLPFVDINSAVASLRIEQIKTIHIMASGTSTYIPIVRKLLISANGNSRDTVDVYICFRLGTNSARIESLKNLYDIWWNNLKAEFPEVKFHFIPQIDFKNSFRGLVINREIGLVGFYVRVHENTIGTLDDCIFVNKSTDVGRYVLDYFLKCFKNQPESQSLKECIEQIGK